MSPIPTADPIFSQLTSDLHSLLQFFKPHSPQEQRVLTISTPVSGEVHPPPIPTFPPPPLNPLSPPFLPANISHPTDSKARARKAAKRAGKLVADQYQLLARKDCPRKDQVFYNYLGKSFTDIEEDEHFQITKIVFPIQPPKKGQSIAPFFRYFDTKKFSSAPALEPDYEHTPCAEFVKRRRGSNIIFFPNFIKWDIPSASNTRGINSQRTNSSTPLGDEIYKTLGEAHMASVLSQPIDMPCPIIKSRAQLKSKKLRPFQRRHQKQALAHSTFHSSPSDPILNISVDGTPFTYNRLRKGPDGELWKIEYGTEIAKLLDSKTLCPQHWKDQPIDQRGNTTYFNPQVKEKLDSNRDITRRVRGTLGGNKIKYDGPTSSPVADIVTIKSHQHTVISDRRNHGTDTRYATLDLSDFYLGSSLDSPCWVDIPTEDIPMAILLQYNLLQYISKGKIRCRVDGTMYGHPVAGRIAHLDLVAHLATHGYIQDPNIPCLFSHTTSPISFTLVVDDFGVKYCNRDDFDELVRVLELRYKLKTDLSGAKYIGVRLEWDYKENALWHDMPTTCDAAISRFCPNGPPPPQKSPGKYLPPKYGAPDLSATVDDTPLVSEEQKSFIMAVVGVFLFYARMVDHTMLPAITFISKKQSAPTEMTLAATHHFLGYVSVHRHHRVKFTACDMVLKVISDGSHLSQEKAGSIAGGYHFCGNRNDPPTVLNGAILPVCSSIPTVCGAASETEYAALYINAQNAYFERAVLSSLGYPQQPTEIYADNMAAVGVATDTVKLRRSKAIDMRYHWIRDRVRQGVFKVIWSKGAENDADFFTKLQPIKRHQYFISRFVTS